MNDRVEAQRGEDPKAPRTDSTDAFQRAMDAVDRGEVRPTTTAEASRDSRRLFSREGTGRDTRRSTR